MATKLPTIDKRDSISGNGSRKNLERRMTGESRQEYKTPFQLPSDDEVFVYREVERQKREDLKQVSKDMKIWDKKTGTSRKPLRLFKDYDPNVKETKAPIRRAYTAQEKAVIVEAQQVINDRRKMRDTSRKDLKEGIVDLLDQKKEMFLVERTIGIIEKEKEMLVQKANDKGDALKKSDEMLEKDQREFESYKQSNKVETDQAVQKYNQEVELRKRTETEFKIKNNELTSLKAEKTKNEELIQKYLDAENFLGKLTPKEILEHNEKLLALKIEEFKAEWLEKELSNRDETQSAYSESNLKGLSNRDKRIPSKKNIKAELEKMFMEKLEKGELVITYAYSDEIEDFKLNQKMYFTDPEQLIEIFTRLEEENVGLIQMMQDTEQNLENLKNMLKQKKVEFDKKIAGLRENKMQLERSKNEKEARVRALINQSKEPQLTKKQDGLLPLTKKMIEVAGKFKDESKGAIDIDGLQPLDLLAMIELNLEKQLQKLNEYKPARIMELKRDCEDVRKAENRKLQAERENRIAEEKRIKANERAREKPKKRQGRPDMMKSTPFETKEAETEVVQTNDEEEDMKYFKPYLTKF